ncbi:MAG: phosphodiesterase [Bacteroidales bacterium]|nr:phosphodiesterase [Bacteroidales bacterium]
MKYFIFSDIHGSATACERALEQYAKLGCDKIICLGDILYHGPRNPIPEGYDNKRLYDILNPLSDKIIACRGNCDCEVCEMVLNFPLMSDYNLINDNQTVIFATHGHVYSPLNEQGNPEVSGSKPASKQGYNIFLYGHTHVQVLKKDNNGKIICNPGSIILPKGGSPMGFAVYEDSHVALYDIKGNKLSEL